MTNENKLIFRDILRKTGYFNRKPSKGRLTGRAIYIKYDLDNDVIKILKLNTKFKSRGFEKIIIPSNIIEIYTRLDFLPGQKISGHTDTLTEASNSIDELYKRGELQNEQQNRNALNKLSTH